MANQVVVELGTVIKNRGTYDSSAKYYKDNVVQYQNSSYIVTSVPQAIGYLQNVVPTTPNSGWSIFAYGAADVIAKTPRVDVSQSFTDAEKKQVRANIGLGNGDIDNEPTANSNNVVKSGGVASAIKATEIVDGSVETKAELSFVDEENNCIAQFKDGEIKTKNFNSSTAATKTYVNTKVATDIAASETTVLNKVAEVDNAEDDDASVSIVDESAECIAQFKNGHIKTKNFDSSNIDLDKNYPEIIVPEKIIAVVDDTLQIFFKSIVSSSNCYNYGISAVCDIGSSYIRYYQVKPTVSKIGNHTLTFNVYDNNGKIVVTKSTTLVVVNKLSSNVSPSKNILTIAGSTYTSGAIIGEVNRRFSASSGDGTPMNPTGLNITGVNFIGRKEVNSIHQEASGGYGWRIYATNDLKAVRFTISNSTLPILGERFYISGVSITETYYFTVIGFGVNNDILCEVYGGYIYSEGQIPSTGTLVNKTDTSVTYSYGSRVLESGNPFWYNGRLDFKNYSNIYCNNANIDVIYTHLGLNGFTSKSEVDYQIEQYVEPFIRAFDDEIYGYPGSTFVLGTLQLGSPNGGYGYKGYASAEKNWYNLSNVYWYALKKYQELANRLNADTTFNSTVVVSDVTSEFDSENGYPKTSINVNNRVNETETIQTDNIHPTGDGDKMISDSIYRILTELLNN